MKKKIVPLLIASSALISACNTQTNTDTQAQSATEAAQPAAATPAISKNDAVAIVNGQYISKATFDELAEIFAQRSHGQTLPKEQLLEELIQRELLIQDALNKKLDQTPDFIAQLDAAKKSILSQAALQNYLQANPVTDAEIQAEYAKSINGADSKEYKARHILLKTEQEAKDLIVKLNEGADFAELATANSIGPTKTKGGDLGWFSAKQMVEPFSQAVIALEDNKFTTEPVQTQFGWHVILREGIRERAAPPLEAVKAQLEPFLQRQKIRAMLDGLRQQASVEVLLPAEPEQPAPADTAAEVAPQAENAVEAVQDAASATADEAKTQAEAGVNAVKEAVNTATEKAETAVDATEAN